VAIHDEVGNQFILEIKASVVTADMNAHEQFNHANCGQ
jgi:hypothetical protein